MAPAARRATAVHVWLIDLDVDSADAAACLSTDERERARRFVHEHHRRWYERSHAVLRALLARQLGRPLDQICYRTSPAGKPLLAGSPLQFSLAHCDGQAAVAIAAHRAVGVDIEKLRPINDVDDLARECFSKSELRQFSTVANSERDAAFLVAWSRKEAVLKALGTGLLRPPASVETGLTPDAVLISFDRQRVCLTTRVTSGLAASVATLGDAHEIHWTSIRWCDAIAASASTALEAAPIA